MKPISVLEDVLPLLYWKDIRDRLTHPDLPWYYSEEISLDASLGNPFKENSEVVQSCGFSHPLYVKDQYTSKHWELIKPMIYFMAEKSGYSKFKREITPFRVKANLLTQHNGSTADSFNIPHIDPAHIENKATNWVFLYYLLDSDGDTFIFNETANLGVPARVTLKERITPRANTGILFKDNLYHASSNPVRHQKRISVNFNLLTS